MYVTSFIFLFISLPLLKTIHLQSIKILHTSSTDFAHLISMAPVLHACFLIGVFYLFILSPICLCMALNELQLVFCLSLFTSLLCSFILIMFSFEYIWAVWKQLRCCDVMDSRFGSAFTTNKDQLFRIIQALLVQAQKNVISSVQIKAYLIWVICSF